MKKILSILIVLGFLSLPVFGQWSALNNIPWERFPIQGVKTWKVPSYMIENLNYMAKDFNRNWELKIEFFKKELRSRFIEFKHMPDDVVLVLDSGIFIKHADYLKLIEAQKKKEKEANEKNN